MVEKKPNVRLTEELLSRWGKHEQDLSEPASEADCKYDRHIIGISHQKHEHWIACQFLFSDGTRTNINTSSCDQSKFVDEYIPEGAPISRV